MNASSAYGRAVALLALGATAVAVVFMLGASDEGSYEVTAEFENASQLVTGNEVIVGGLAAGSVKSIELGDKGQALVRFSVNEPYAPLRRGTKATVRSYSLSGVANRQIQLTLPADGQGGAEIPHNGTLTQQETVSEVDLDEIFNTLDKETVADFKRVIKGFEISYDGVEKQANRGVRFANPFLSSSRRVFAELTFDERRFERLIVDTAKLSGALAERAPDVSALIGNLNEMMNAIARQKGSLAEAISKFPDFMRNANTTFVNLRAALDDVDPLVEASKPAARELRPFMSNLRGAVADAVPTVTDLNRLIRHAGPANDLVEITRLQPSLERRAIGSGAPDCGGGDLSDPANGAGDDDFTQGAFGESVCSLINGNPTLANFRPYTPELVGWFDDFSHPGTIDALGGIGRISTSFNQFTISTPGFPDLADPVNPLDALTQTDLDDKCPGAQERPLPPGLGVGGNPFTDGGNVDCDPTDVLDEP